MLEEILSLVRSIDKATNATIPTGSLSIRSAEWAHLFGVSNDSVAQSLKAKLMAEVAKSVPILASILERASPQFADETLTLNFPMYLDTPGFEFLTKPPYFDGLKKAASGLGFRVKVVKGSTSFDL